MIKCLLLSLKGGDTFVIGRAIVAVMEFPKGGTTSSRVCLCAVLAAPPDAFVCSFSSDERFKDSSSQPSTSLKMLLS
jgi:hypothetical protein